MQRGSVGAQLIPLAPEQLLVDATDVEDIAAGQTEVMPAESHPYVTNARQSGRVHERNPHRPASPGAGSGSSPHLTLSWDARPSDSGRTNAARSAAAASRPAYSARIPLPAVNPAMASAGLRPCWRPILALSLAIQPFKLADLDRPI